MGRDTIGLCRAELHVGDDHGDNRATMRCQLVAGHPEQHRETWRRGPHALAAVVEWEGDDRPLRERHACVPVDVPDGWMTNRFRVDGVSERVLSVRS